MPRLFPSGLLSNIRGDLFGGITAAVIALPLALAFGVASGAGPIAGLYGAIALGFFAAFFGGTPSQISGPTGPMTVVMAAIIAQYQHDPALVFTIVMMGGLLQVLFGAIGIGRYINYVPYPVISGFMSGIGIIIIILQLGAITGHETSGNIIQTISHLPGFWMAPVIPALATGILALFVVFLLPVRIRQYIPPPLAALIAGTLFSLFIYQGAPVLGEVPHGLPQLYFPKLTLHDLPQMLSSALTLAMLGSIDSLLTSLVADNFTRTQHRSGRELIGQGIGNMFAGLIGGLPGAGATMRTVVNIRAGGRTPLSGVVHALALLACVLGLGFLVEDIPKAVLAGILLKVGYDIIDWPFLARLRYAGLKDADRQGMIVMLTVLVLTVFVDLITAVAIGIVAESLITARRLATHQIEDVQFATAGGQSDIRHKLSQEEEDIIDSTDGKLLLLRFAGPLSFGTARDLSARIQSIYDDIEAVVIDLTDTRMMDVSIMVTLADMVDQMVSQKTQVYVSGTKNPVYNPLVNHKVFEKVPESHVCPDRRDALLAAKDYIQARKEKL